MMIDHYKGFCSVKPISTANSQETAQHILQWIEQHGNPCTVQTDNGPEFDSNYQSALFSNNILQRKGVVARPEHQGIVERLNREFRQHVDLFLQSRELPDTCWEWAAIAFEHNHNRMISKNQKLSYTHAFSKLPPIQLWSGDRICFKPRNKEDKESCISEISKRVVGT